MAREPTDEEQQKKSSPCPVAVRWSHVRFTLYEAERGVPQRTFFFRRCCLAHKTAYHSIPIIVAEVMPEKGL
ncbi:hypothetical protein J3F83DRAFT_723254 [Trichoderma novae-zelandiae]